MVRIWVSRRTLFLLTSLVQDGLLNTIVPDGEGDEEWNLRFQNGFNRVRKWTSQSDVLNKTCLFIPVNLYHHWSLIIVYDHIGYLVMSRLVVFFVVLSRLVVSCLVFCYLCLGLTCLVLSGPVLYCLCQFLILSCRCRVLYCLET